MVKIIKFGVIFALLFSLTIANTADFGVFQKVETETFDKQDFLFPDDFSGEVLNLVFLSMSDDQDVGQRQGEALLEWQAALDEQELFSDQIKGYHFAVIKAPFFIKGVIRNAMRKNFEGKVPLNQAGILFIKDLEKFADAAKLTIDDQPKIIFVSPAGKIMRIFKGDLSEQGLNELLSAAAEYANMEPVPADS